MLGSAAKSLLTALGQAIVRSAVRWTVTRDLPRFIRTTNAASACEYFRLSCFAVGGLPDEVVLCRVLSKYLMFVDGRDVGLSPHLIMDGYWEYWITVAMCRSIRPGMRVIDVGANVGYYTVLMADLVGPVGKVSAFEPNPRMAKLLRRSVSSNGFSSRVVIDQRAVAASQGQTELYIPPGEPKNATITAVGDAEGERFEVSTTTIDDCARGGVDFIKIDAEGGEEAIWKGMEATVAANPQLIILLEFNASRYPDPRSFLDRIARAGLILRHVTFTAEIEAVSPERIMAERPGEDWMLYLARR